MPGTTPHEAVRTFLAPFQENLAILDGHGQIGVRRKGLYRVGVPYYWSINGESGMAERMLAETEGIHKLYRSWSDSPDQPHPEPAR